MNRHRFRALAVFPVAALGAIALVPSALRAQSFTWGKHFDGPPQRGGVAMVYDTARGVAVLYGGDPQAWQLYEWNGMGPGNGAGWANASASGPPARSTPAMAYDAARGETVLFGGGGDTDTWEWNGTVWTQHSVSGPTARFRSAMVYDLARHVTVLFGGTGGGLDHDDTWEWNGTSWTQRLVGGPSPREQHAMAYDAARATTVLFGGICQNGTCGVTTVNGETWEWNGNGGGAWNQRIVDGPAPRFGCQMAYDSARHVTVLFGGSDLHTNYFDTWEWDGEAWTQRMISGPDSDTGNAMAYDSIHHQTMLWGPLRDGDLWLLGCAADFNHSGALETADIFSFLNAWFAGSPTADFDGVNGLQTADIFAFLNAWFAGC